MATLGRLLVLCCLAAAFAPGAQPAPSLRGTMEQAVFPSAAGPLGVDVYLPAGCSAGGRYPVVYFLHGLPAPAVECALRAPLFASCLDGLGDGVIAVVPQAARAHDSDPEFLDWSPGGPGRRRSRSTCPAGSTAASTRSRPPPRALVGISTGGYGAALLGLDHPEEFGVIESWSGYFEPTDPSGTHALVLTTAQEAQTNLHQRVPTWRPPSGRRRRCSPSTRATTTGASRATTPGSTRS